MKFSFERYQRRRRHAAQGEGQGGPGRRRAPRALRAQGAVAGLHDLLRHHRHRRRLDRAQEVRREGRRRRLQEGAHRRRARTSSCRFTARASSWSLEAFDGYWRKAPSVKRLVMRSIPDETTRAAALKRGEVDVAYFLNGPIAEDVRRTPGAQAHRPRAPTPSSSSTSSSSGMPKSPWADRRVRLAASLAIDRKAINEAEFARLRRAHRQHRAPAHGVRAADRAAPPTIPSAPSSSWPRPAIPNGFDAGDLTPNPPYFSMGEAIVDNLGAVGIRTRMRTMERAAFLTAWREKKLHGRRAGRPGRGGQRGHAHRGAGHQATGSTPTACCPRSRISSSARPRRWTARSARSCCTRSSASSPIASSSRRSGRTRFIRGVGPRVEEAALTLITAFPYSAPFEDLRLKRNAERRDDGLHEDLRRLPHRPARCSRPTSSPPTRRRRSRSGCRYVTDGPDGPYWTCKNGGSFGLAERRGAGRPEARARAELPRGRHGRDRPLRGRPEGPSATRPTRRCAPRTWTATACRPRSSSASSARPPGSTIRGGQRDVPHLQRLAGGLLPARPRRASSAWPACPTGTSTPR